jgi:superfamily I DNA/RNA helicase
MNDETCVAITGGPATGKSTQLLVRIRACDGVPLVLAASEPPLAFLRNALPAGSAVRTTGAFAATLLREPARIIDDVEAELLFAKAAAPLLALEWPEFSDETLDPEVPGLRAPQRFLEAAFRLMRKLLDACISPEEFLQSAQVGATSFYARPPNFASADLLRYTKDTYRDSLDVTTEEIQRQFRHETHLARILAALFRAYLDARALDRLLTPRDAIAEATALVTLDAGLRHEVREGYAAIFVDDAQELNIGELKLLQAICGDALRGVVAAGDPQGAIGTFRGARPDRVFAVAAQRIVCEDRYRANVPMRLHRAADQRAESRWIADEVADLLRGGTPAKEIALIFRSVGAVRVYEEALLQRGIATQTIGDVNAFCDPRAMDALALLWNVYDPFRHDWLLRTLCAPALALSDASLVVLCAQPPDAQTLLFEPEGEADAPRRRWDAQRDLRLGTNVIRGDADADLAPLARERIERFRAMRLAWVEASASLRPSELARAVWREGLAQLGARESAAARSQAIVLRRLLDRIRAFEDEHPNATLGDVLSDAEARAESDLEACEDPSGVDCVRLISVEAARGCAFDSVIVPNARPGAFPRWYVPDAFVYSPTQGMIAKENVGEARASRTAKFTYYMFRTKTRERYNDEERRAFSYALSRARKSLIVTAWDRATRGITAPEFFEELKAAKLPGTEIL